MAGFLLDTNVLSETRKKRPHARVLQFLAEADAAQLFMSVLTIGELRKGVEKLWTDNPKAAGQIGAWADRLEVDYADRILGVDIATARLWGELSAARALPVIDTLIAATALVHGLTLVTRNGKDVAATGVPLLDPWRASS